MSVLKKTKVAAGIAAAVFASGAAQAATISSPSTAPNPAYAKSIVDEVVQTTVNLPAISIALGVTESLDVTDSVTFRLNGGATFKSITAGSLTDNCGGNVAAGCASYALVSGGAGETFATYRVGDNPSNTGTTLTLSGNVTIDMSSSTATSVTATMSGFVGGIATDLFGSPLTSLAVQSVPMMTLSLTTQSTGTFDVATGFTSLLGTNLTSNTATVSIATNAAASTNATSNAGAAAVPTGAPTPANTLLTLSGPMASVASITDPTGANLITSSTCAGSTATTTLNTMAVDTTTDQACAVMAGTAGPGLTDVVNLQITFDGTTTNDVADYDLSVTRLVDGSYSATSVGSVTPFVFGRNGSAFASNSFGPLNKITVTDRSGSLGGTGSADGQINLTVYDKTGAQVTCTGLMIDSLASNSTVTIQGADVIAACPGAKRIEGTVNSNSILVTNVKTTADGATATPALSSGGNTAAQ